MQKQMEIIGVRTPVRVKRKLEEQAAAAKMTLSELLNIYFNLLTRHTSGKIEQLIEIHSRLGRAYSLWVETVGSELNLMDAGAHLYAEINPGNIDSEQLRRNLEEALEALTAAGD